MTGITDSGNILGKTAKAVLKGKGFEIVNYLKRAKQNDKYGKELLLMNVPFDTIYRHKGNTEFLLVSEKYNIDGDGWKAGAIQWFKEAVKDKKYCLDYFSKTVEIMNLE